MNPASFLVRQPGLGVSSIVRKLEFGDISLTIKILATKRRVAGNELLNRVLLFFFTRRRNHYLPWSAY